MGLREAYTQGGIGNALGWLGEKTQENLATSAPALVGGLAAALTAPFSVPVAALIGGSTLVGSSIMGTGEVAQEMEDKTGEYNDAVAMTGGQSVDGPISVEAIATSVLAEGAKKVVIVSDQPDRFHRADLPRAVTVHHRIELDRIQRELREVPGTQF